MSVVKIALNGLTGRLTGSILRLLCGLIITSFFLGMAGEARADTNEAKKVFEKYVECGKKFDPALADLFSDNAFIKNTRRYPDGTSRPMQIPAPAYKKVLRSVMPLAKERGDTDTFSEVIYKQEGEKVRVTAKRYSELKKNSSPYSMVVAKEDGKWLIVEEISESRP